MDENLSILTFKIKLKRNFIRKNTSSEKRKWYKFRRDLVKQLKTAKRIAEYSIHPANKYRKLTSADVGHLGKIKTCISNQIIRKYKNNKTIKNVHNVNLIVPACSTAKNPSIKYNLETKELNIVPLKLKLKWNSPVRFDKINQVEINDKYAYLCVTLSNQNKKEYKRCIGVDLNIKHNLASVGYKKKDKCDFLGKGYIYERVKYKEIRRRFQKQGRLNKVKEMGNKEQRVMKDLNQKLSNEILNISKKRKANIAFEQLSGIRKTRCNRNFSYFLNSWQFYQLQQNVVYKAKLQGIEVLFVDPRYTSQDCSNCGERNKPNGKKYKCKSCGLKIHRDKNASFNIADRGKQAWKNLNK